jgi:hypothetical protein
MIGHSLRKTPGIRPQMRWTFVQAPIGATQKMLFVWRLNKGVIYLSRAQFKRVKGDPLATAFVRGVAERIEADYWDGRYAEYQGFADTNECVNAQAVARWLGIAAEHPQMREDAFIVFSMIARVDPDVETPFVEWAEQLPVAI